QTSPGSSRAPIQVAYQAAAPSQQAVAADAPRHSMGAGTLLALVFASGGAIIAILVLGVALLRGKPGPAAERGGVPVAVMDRNGTQGGTAPTEEESEHGTASPSESVAGADQAPDSTPSKKKSRSSTSKKDPEGDDAPSASSSRADAGQRVYRNLLKSAVFIIN